MRGAFFGLLAASALAASIAVGACKTTSDASAVIDASVADTDAAVVDCDCYVSEDYDYMGGCPGGSLQQRRG